MRYFVGLVIVLFSFNLNAQCERVGDFVAFNASVYDISGTADVQRDDTDRLTINFRDDFETVQGIRLELFLSKTSSLNTSTDLKVSTSPLGGSLTLGTPMSGARSFDVPLGANIDEYDYIIVQCTSANIQWGRVALGEASADCAVTNTNDLESSTISVFPNPTSDFINFNTANTENIERVLFYSIDGKLVKSENGLKGNRIDITDLESGTYIMKLQSEFGEIVKRIFKN